MYLSKVLGQLSNLASKCMAAADIISNNCNAT